MSHMLQAITVFYAEPMVAEANSFSPSAGKPRQVLAAWKADHLPIAIQPFLPVDEHDLALCHDPAYVRGVLTCTLPNGFGNWSPDVARSLPWTSGALLSAARHALREGIACAPVSGFDHAAEFGIPDTVRSCHTAKTGNCFIQGHVPAAAIAKLLAERPALKGIALPGMPAGPPGMGGTPGIYRVVGFTAEGHTSHFADVGP
jgi:hypothetical protein